MSKNTRYLQKGDPEAQKQYVQRKLQTNKNSTQKIDTIDSINEILEGIQRAVNNQVSTEDMESIKQSAITMNGQISYQIPSNITKNTEKQQEMQQQQNQISDVDINNVNTVQNAKKGTWAASTDQKRSKDLSKQDNTQSVNTYQK